ncbi:MAG: ABC transporter substrate-binding protein [Candidatus Paceibacterota bacterium]|jgi:peptide/nickel transport system substrate-binding protein
MKNFYNYIRNLRLPKKHELKSAISSFSKKEWLIFIGLILILFTTTIIILQNVNKHFMIDVPMQGGSISEGILGSPRFVNPVLAISDADRDLVALVYSGLMRKGLNNTLIPDLAEKYEISKDGLTYTFTLKNKIYFQDKKPVTVDDIIFTINQIKDPIIKSPKKGNWDGVNIEKVDEKTIKFILKQPYASFLENTTLGILPAHIWEGSPIELNEANINPIGSGPYQVLNVNKESSGIIDLYELEYFKKFILGKPHISNITLRFYQNEKDLVSALQNGNVDQISSITPENAEILRERNYNVNSFVLPRVFGLFFNQNEAQVFTDKSVVQAINQAIDKNRIIQEVLWGYGVQIDNPIPPSIMSYQKLIGENTIITQEERLQKAEEILNKNGWKKGTNGLLEKTTTVKNKKTTQNLTFTISTGNAPELVRTAELIKLNLEEIGMQVDVKTFEVGNLNQTVIRPRQYDALLFGQIINNQSDLFAFWHSSQRKDPGLNVAMYANAKVDKILEDAFITVDNQSRIKKYAQFEEEIKKDVPAVFLYSPNFIYVVSKNLKGFSLDHITSPSDRFTNAYLWYTKIDSVWKIFSK